MKWKQELETRNLNETNVSQGIKNKIRDYNDTVNVIGQLKEKIENPDLNDDVDEIKETLSELEEALEVQDKVLVRSIEKYDKNKDIYNKNATNLKNNKNKSVDATSGTEKQPTAVPQGQPASAVNEDSGTEVTETPKKKSDWAWLGFAALATVVTLGAYNFFKNKD